MTGKAVDGCNTRKMSCQLSKQGIDRTVTIAQSLVLVLMETYEARKESTKLEDNYKLVVL